MEFSEISRNDTEICLHYGDEPETFNGAVVPPTYGNSLFVYPTFEQLSEALKNEQKNYVYWRGSNPTVEVVEKKLAALERGEQCKCFASGMAAISSAILNSVQSGDHVLFVSNVYFSTVKILKYLKKFNIEHSVIYSTNINDIEKSLKYNTKLIFIECPTDLNFRLIDLKELSSLARLRNIRTVIDNTWATPLYQKPLTLGIDIVVHSASKYLSGHSDLVGGALITNKDIMNDLFVNEYLLFGGVMGPYDATLLLRGIRTLPLRMKAHQENAFKIAQFLDAHPDVSKVNFPGLPSHADYELAQIQLLGYSSLMTFELKDSSFVNINSIINKTKVFQIGVSWGSFESLIMSPNFGNNTEQMIIEGVYPGMIRLYVGLEDASVLIDDLNQALS